MRTWGSTDISELVALDCFDRSDTVVDIVMKRTPAKFKVCVCVKCLDRPVKLPFSAIAFAPRLSF